MSGVNEIVFTPEKYDGDREAMWGDIMTFIKMLLTNQYVATIRDDDIDVIVIHYEHDERFDAWGVKNPYWLTEEEYIRALETGEDE